jgi:hypothetical protein
MKNVIQAAILLAVAATPAFAGGATPVAVTPEPGTIALVVTGLGAIGVGAWWKRRK